MCESFYLPTQFVEIGFRNTVVAAMDQRFGRSWPLLFKSPQLTALPRGAREKIQEAAESALRGGKPLLADRVIAALHFGFWCKMLESRYDQVLWQRGLRRFLPNLPPDLDRNDVRRRLHSIKDFRNRVAHHEPIYHVKPRKRFDEMMEVIGWMCQDTAVLVRAMSDVETVLSNKPRP